MQAILEQLKLPNTHTHRQHSRTLVVPSSNCLCILRQARLQPSLCQRIPTLLASPWRPEMDGITQMTTSSHRRLFLGVRIPMDGMPITLQFLLDVLVEMFSLPRLHHLLLDKLVHILLQKIGIIHRPLFWETCFFTIGHTNFIHICINIIVYLLYLQ